MNHKSFNKSALYRLRLAMASVAIAFFAVSAYAQSDSDPVYNPHLAFFVQGQDEAEKFLASWIEDIRFDSDGATLLLNLNPQNIPSGMSTESRGWSIPGLKKIEFLDEPWEPSAINSVAQSRHELKISPNPVADRFRVEGVAGNLELYSMTGKCLLKIQGYAGGDVRIPDLPKGIYILKIGKQSAKLIKK